MISCIAVLLIGGIIPSQPRFTNASNTTITVSSLADSGSGSLRDAIATANLATDNVLINFSVSGTIDLESDLPRISILTGAITIDGGNTITLHKNYLGKGIGLRIALYSSNDNPSNNILRNLILDGFENGVLIFSDNNRIENLVIKGPAPNGSCDNTGEHGIAILNRFGVADPIGNTILNNSISCYRKGILAQNPSATTISGNTIINNTSTADLITSPVFNDANPCFVAGIEIQGAYFFGSPANLTKNYITGNQITHSGTTTVTAPCSPALFRSAGVILSMYGDTYLGHDNPTHLNRVAHNEISDNVGDGIAIFQGYNNEIFNNHIARNGSVPSLVDPTDDTGNGISLFCNEGGVIGAATNSNIMYQNTIEHNADNGIFVGKLCEVTGTPQADTNDYNPIIENNIFENGRVSGTVDVTHDDGIGIDLQDQSALYAAAYTTGNANISLNDGTMTNGGNQMVDTPSISSATYNSGDGSWTMTGSTFVGATGGAMVELYQVGCASTNLPANISTCDIDNNPDVPTTYGYGQGRTFLGRAYVASGGSTTWTINLPSTVGFGGGVLTATNTLADTGLLCVAPPTGAMTTLVEGNALCSTSEFSANFFAPPPAASVTSGMLTKIIAPGSIAQGGTGTTILSFTNTGTVPFTAVDITDDLTTPDVVFVPGSCHWNIDATPTGGMPCDFSAHVITPLTGFTTLTPGQTLYITFDFTVPLGAAITTHVNHATASVTPTATIAEAIATFNVTAAAGPSISGVFTKLMVPSTIQRTGTGTTILNLTNTGQSSFTSVTITDDLTAPDLVYVPLSCSYAVDVMPTAGVNNCSLSGASVNLDSFSPLLPGHTLYVEFNVAVPADATLGTHTNTANVGVTPAALISSASADFIVSAAPLPPADGPPACSTTGTAPDARFTVNGSSHTNSYSMVPGSLTVLNTHPLLGDNPIHFNWIYDGTSESTSSGATLTVAAGVHALTHVVSDCDGSVAVSTMSIVATAAPADPVPALALHKSISPSSNLHIGDLTTVAIQVNNPTTSSTFTALNLTDTLTGLSNLIPVCNFDIDLFPAASASTCTVGTNGVIHLDLSSSPLLPGHALFIRYTGVVTGTPATYHDAVAYTSSTPTVVSTPTNANADFVVVANAPGGPVCTPGSLVDASFTLNGDDTPLERMTEPAGSYTLVNDSTTGDAPVIYRWYVDGTLQSEATGTLTRTITDTTTFTLLKSDCDGSASMDTLTLLVNGDVSVPPSPTPSASPSVSPSPSPSATPTTNATTGFTVEKVILNPLALYSTDAATHTVRIKSTIHNLASTASNYTFTDTISNVFLPTVTVDDAAGGTDVSSPGLIRVTDIVIPALGSKDVIYTLTVKSSDNFPLSSYHLDTNATKEDSDFYPVRVKSASLNSSTNEDAENILDAPDGLLVNLGARGSVVVDLGQNKLLVDGDGADLAVAMTQGKVTVSVSQDGRSFEKLHGTNSFDLADADLSWARYIKITDNSADPTLTASVDAVCLLNLGVNVSDTSQVALASDVRSNTVPAYIDVTGAFNDPISAADCRNPKVATKQARTVELTPAPTPSVFYSLPAAPVTPPPAPIQLPKTGPEGWLLILGLASLATWCLRPRKVAQRVRINDLVEKK